MGRLAAPSSVTTTAYERNSTLHATSCSSYIILHRHRCPEITLQRSPSEVDRDGGADLDKQIEPPVDLSNASTSDLKRFTFNASGTYRG